MGNSGPVQFWGSFVVIWSVSESIFQQQFGENHEIPAVIPSILTAARLLGSRDYHNKSLMMILGITGVLFCKIEQTYIEWIIVYSIENTYLGAQRSQVSQQSQVKDSNIATTLSTQFFVSFSQSLLFPGRLKCVHRVATEFFIQFEK